MNSYKFSDLSVGMSESFTVTITEEMMDKFIVSKIYQMVILLLPIFQEKKIL